MLKGEWNQWFLFTNTSVRAWEHSKLCLIGLININYS